MAMNVVINNMGTYQDFKPQVSEQNSQVAVDSPLPKQNGFTAGRSEQPSSDRGKDQQEGKLPEEKMKAAIQQVNKKVGMGHTNAQFVYHEATKRVSIKLVDSETQEVIKEIPPEKTLEMFTKMWELAGILVDEKR